MTDLFSSEAVVAALIGAGATVIGAAATLAVGLATRRPKAANQLKRDALLRAMDQLHPIFAEVQELLPDGKATKLRGKDLALRGSILERMDELIARLYVVGNDLMVGRLSSYRDHLRDLTDPTLPTWNPERTSGEGFRRRMILDVARLELDKSFGPTVRQRVGKTLGLLGVFVLFGSAANVISGFFAGYPPRAQSDNPIIAGLLALLPLAIGLVMMFLAVWVLRGEWIWASPKMDARVYRDVERTLDAHQDEGMARPTS